MDRVHVLCRQQIIWGANLIRLECHYYKLGIAMAQNYFLGVHRINYLKFLS